MDLEQWKEYKKRSRDWNIRMKYELLHSAAYRDLNYAPALKVLNWFHEKIRVEKIEGRRGKQRFQVKDGGEMSFTYREAEHRGLTHQKFRRAIWELHHFGFLDVVRPGSSIKGDYSVFKLSSRWKGYGTPHFEEVQFPKSVHYINFGYGARKRRLCREGNGKKLGVNIHT